MTILDLFFVNEQDACALGSEVPVAQRSHRDEHRAKIAPDVSETIFVPRWRWLERRHPKTPAATNAFNGRQRVGRDFQTL